MIDPSLVADIELLTDFGPEDLAAVSAGAERRRLPRGAVVFEEDAEPAELFVVISGRVAVASRAADGRESLMALRQAGDVFGELALFDGGRHFGLARAVEPSEVVAIAYAPLRAIYELRPALLWRMVTALAKRLRASDEALADSRFLDVTGRTAKRLLEMAGAADEFVLPVTQSELAAMVGASRERVNKAIANFVRLGWIEQSEPNGLGGSPGGAAARMYRISDRAQLSLRAR